MPERKQKLRDLEKEIAYISVEIEKTRTSRPTARERLIELQERLRVLLLKQHEMKYQ